MNTQDLRPQRKRNIQISLRVSEEEYAYFLNQVEKTHLSKSGYLRTLITGKEIPVRQPKEYFEVRRMVSNMANNINQIARVANTYSEIDKGQIQVLQQMMQKCWFKIRDL